MALLTAVLEDDGSSRLYFTRLGTVVSYVEQDTPHCLRAVVEPGALAWPKEYARAAERVRRAMIEELAERMNVPPEEVLFQSMQKICEVADAPLAERNPWTGRSKTRRRN